MDAFTVDPAHLQFTGSGLQRPECVLCTAAGDLYCSDARGGVSHLAPDGGVTFIGPAAGADAQPPVLPNGIAMLPDGSFLLADLGRGGVYRLSRDGALAPYLMEADGQPLPATNFVRVDDQERVWVTVSTRRVPRQLGYRPDVDDGFIVLRDARGTRIVADGLGFTNECHLDARGEWLYVNETYTRCLSRFAVRPDGDLGPREEVTRFGPGTFPDGLALDAEGAVWVTSVVSNRVIRVTPDGTEHLVLEDSDPAHLERVERVYQAGEMTREHMDTIPTRYLQHCASIAFGGPDLRTAYLGSLLGERIAWFRSPVAGLAPPHWRWGP